MPALVCIQPTTLSVNLLSVRAEAREILEAANLRAPNRGLTAHALARLLVSSPAVEPGDAEKALDLALRVYGAKPSVAHGETAALALARLGRCEEAAALQRRIADAAIAAQDDVLAARLSERLRRYEAGPPCAPEDPR